MIYLDFLFHNHSQTKHKESLNHGQDTFEFVNAKACDQELSDCFVEWKLRHLTTVFVTSAVLFGVFFLSEHEIVIM